MVEINGAAVALGTPGRTADFAGVHKSPYKIPTPWSAMYYFKVDADLVARLGEATKLTVRMLEAAKSGAVKTVFETEVSGRAPQGLRCREMGTFLICCKFEDCRDVSAIGMCKEMRNVPIYL